MTARTWNAVDEEISRNYFIRNNYRIRRLVLLCIQYYTIMDFLLSKYGLIFTEFDSIDRGGAEVNTFKFSKYQSIFTD